MTPILMASWVFRQKKWGGMIHAGEFNMDINNTPHTLKLSEFGHTALPE